MGYKSITTLDTTEGITSLSVGLGNFPPVIITTYNHTTKLIASTAVDAPIEIEYSNWKELINSLSNWAENIKDTFQIKQAEILFLHKLEYEVKSGEITVILKTFNNEILLDMEFVYSSKVIILKPRIALVLTYSDLLYWLQILSTFRQLITRRGY